MVKLRIAAFAMLYLLLMSLVGYAHASPGAPLEIPIGYVELADDYRYRSGHAYAGIDMRTWGRAYPGAEVGLADAQAIGDVTGKNFQLLHAREDSVAALANRVTQWQRDRDIYFILADLPADQLLALAATMRDLPVLFFNVSTPDDRLRGADCQPNIAHTYPSNRMLTDALMQYLIAKKWPSLLVLTGEREADALLTSALKKSADKFRARIIDERPFVLGQDPRERNQTNIALLTGEARYDVVFVADSSGEFGRYVPYQTRLPRPVVGSAGLTPVAWHWSWHRHGAAQLQHRFEDAATPRRMNGATWAAWVAVKAVNQAALRAEATDFEAMRNFILGSSLNLDGAKGSPSSFRSWNQQLRQPLLLATGDAVIARLPLPEFLHQVDILDTLGVDEPQSECELSRRPVAAH